MTGGADGDLTRDGGRAHAAGARKRRVYSRGRLRPDLTVDLEAATLLEMSDGRIGCPPKGARAFEVVAELGERELRRADVIALVANSEGAVAEQRREPGLHGAFKRC